MKAARYQKLIDAAKAGWTPEAKIEVNPGANEQ
jgi:hypothetical protein